MQINWATVLAAVAAVAAEAVAIEELFGIKIDSMANDEGGPDEWGRIQCNSYNEE